ncbi:organic cation transporter-like protein isoform X2 [Contarinia nasturtii]|uniref:organic cation transporter-like protein isoform X2 n=1 Tax=Contarinia nasturtii TaxID=265458 RepID=UPI0012D45D23|nr:organic cation transporter-like protein isoform X2 [Contarinia nasturtii]
MATAPSTLRPLPRVDPVTKVLGNFGKFQLSAMLIIFLCKIPTSWFMAIIIFTAPARAHPHKLDKHNRTFVDYCEVFTELWNSPLEYFNTPNQTSLIETKNFTTMKCTHFTFKPEYHSLVADFKLICGRELLLPLSQCFHIFGLLVGGIVAYFLLKHISPKNLMIIGVSAQIIFGNLIGFIRTYEFHILLRALTAASCALMYNSGSVIFTDITNGPAKTITLLVFEFFWSIGLIILPIFNVFIEEWSKLYIAISMPTIALIFLIKYLPDSPRWMLRKNRIDEARQILIEGGNKNKRRVPINLEELLKSEFNTGAANPPQANWSSLWDGKPSRIYILALHYAWSVYVLNFNCVVLNIRAFGRDHLSINTVAIALSEIFGVFIGIYIVLYTSRRWLWSGLAGICSGCLSYLTWFIPQTLKETHVVALEMAPTLAIKTTVSIGMCVLTVCTVELVCAERRKILMFSANSWARGWFLWAPFIFMLRTYDVVLPLTVFGALNVIGGLLMVVVHQNQYKAYLEDCEQRMQAMQKAVRTISNAGLDWIKSVRRSSVYDIEEVRRKSIYDAEEKTCYDQSPNRQ